MTNGSEGIAEYPGRPDYTALIAEARTWVAAPIVGPVERRVSALADAVEALVAENAKMRRETGAQIEAIKHEAIPRSSAQALIDERDALRERLAAAEALIREMGDATDIRHGGKLDRLDRIAMLAAGYRSEATDRG